MGLWNSIKKAARSVGKFVKKNWKVILGVTAAVAIPFVAPMIGGALAGSAFLSSVAPSVASFLGSAAGSGLIGAGLGAASAAVTGQSPLLGAALGGLGGFGGGMMAGQGMFSAAGSGAGGLGLTGANAVTPATGGIIDIGGQTVNAATGLAAPAAAGGISISSLAAKLAANPKAIGALGQLAMTLFNKDLNELTPEEKAQLEEVAAQAATNRALFEQQVTEARKVINMGTPNPEQAYASARFQTENQLREGMRGMPVGLQEAAERKGTIASNQAGLQNVAVDYAKAAQVRQTGLNMMPNEAPTGYNQLAMPTYNSLYERQNKYDEQLNKAVGGLFGSLA